MAGWRARREGEQGMFTAYNYASGTLERYALFKGYALEYLLTCYSKAQKTKLLWKQSTRGTQSLTKQRVWKL
jgi:hypothetical protein